MLQVEMARQQATPPLPADKSAISRPSKRLTEIGSPRIDWVSLAKGMGVDNATRASTCQEFQEQLNAALSRSGPSLIEAVLK